MIKSTYFVRFQTRHEIKAFFDDFLAQIEYHHIGAHMIYESRSWGYTGFVEVVSESPQENWNVYAAMYC